MRHDRRQAGLGDCHGGMPRRGEWSAIHPQGGAHLPHQNRGPVRTSRGETFGARHCIQHLQARRHCRRSWRRFARTDRRERPAHWRRRDATARWTGVARHFQEIAQARRGYCPRGTGRSAVAQARQGTKFLRRRRHLACAGAAAHVADRLSAPRHPRIFHPGRRGARVCEAGAAGGCGNAVARRSRCRCAPPVTCLRSAGAGTSGSHRQAEEHRDFRAGCA